MNEAATLIIISQFGTEMSGTGEKRQLKQLMNNLHEMLKILGQNTEGSLTIKMDEFEYLRRDFMTAAQEYEKASMELPSQSDRKKRGILLYMISSNRQAMDHSLRQMTNLVMRMNEKIKGGKHKNKKGEELETELQYKNLTIFNLGKHYFKLTKKQPKEAGKGKNSNYPDPETLQQLLTKKPQHRGFTERSDHEGSEYLEEKEILDAIKHIDDRIEEKMDYILSGLKMLNHNALSIRDGIDEVQRKILINVETLQENIDGIHYAQDLLEEAAPHASKPNCVMNVIIVILLAILAYLIIRKLIPQSS